mmetsp:Transcript_2792/g.3257  ORF Transcript_2792/g.3257 Transcript_2792/m.3257 type:complete len:82 (-) Transcript_2792:772-1017(-)
MNDIDDDVSMEDDDEDMIKSTKIGVDFIAQKEHHDLAKKIEDNGVNVIKYKQLAEDLPDSVFPNNWISVHKYPQSLDKKVV